MFAIISLDTDIRLTIGEEEGEWEGREEEKEGEMARLRKGVASWPQNSLGFKF